MLAYTENVDGSAVEERESTLVWNYKNAEEEQGNMVAKELYAQVKAALGNTPVEVIQGKGYLEVKPAKLKKRKLVKLLLERAAAAQKLDLLVYVGSDSGNEVVFQYLRSARCDSAYLANRRKFVCTLGKKPSLAQFYVEDAEELSFLINKLRVSTQKRKKIRSFSDLKSVASLESQETANKIFRQDRSSNDVRVHTFILQLFSMYKQ